MLTAYADKEVAIHAINELRLDYYLIKPWDPPAEKLYPVIDGLLEAWQLNYRPKFTGIKVIGFQYSRLSHEIKEFLSGNLVPYQWVDVQITENSEEILTLNKLELKDLPVIFFADGTLLIKPDIKQIAEKTGLSPELKNEVFDVVIVGAGPAGLAAGVYGASEGLNTLLIERHSPGGQAGTSSRIENYLGFPAGISGAELTTRALTQAKRLGVQFLSPAAVIKISNHQGYKKLMLADGRCINTRSIVLTTGVEYRKLEVNGIEDFTGAGIYYGSATTETMACKNKEVYIAGGGNSAGQAAMHLSKFASNVYVIIRRDTLVGTMSTYLIDQLQETTNIHLLGKTEVVEARGTDRLQELALFNWNTKQTSIHKAEALFIFIGAKPYTEWVGPEIIKDHKGFIATGPALGALNGFNECWKLRREPFVLETSCPGIFAAGDVRSGAMSRVASCVGEGSMAINLVHRYLAEVK
ncbi:FAD-dependent oxidoreductase [Mucilaginibacter sp. P25]|uniref:FAD-dependent oxidoreductase n=1 Tax=Mucilaginibacter sp. P25 TaxID=3423945 RepID=UPI003D794D74